MKMINESAIVIIASDVRGRNARLDGAATCATFTEGKIIEVVS